MMIAGLSDYQMTMIIAMGQKYQWAYGKYDGVEGHTFAFRKTGIYSFAIHYDDKPLMEICLTDYCSIKPCVSHPVIDRMIDATSGGTAMGLAHYTHNWPIQQMLYDFVTRDALIADGKTEYKFFQSDSGEVAFVRKGSNLRFFGQRTIAMKRFSNDRTYIADIKFVALIMASTKPVIKLPVNGTFDTVLSLVGAVPEHVAPCSDVSAYSFDDVWGTL